MTMFQTLHRSLAVSATLKLACGGCGRQAAWSQAEAVRRLGADATPADIRRRLVCKVCGGPARVWI